MWLEMRKDEQTTESKHVEKVFFHQNPTRTKEMTK